MIKSYETYKNSGIEWIGEIPNHWEAIKMKFIGYLFSGLSGKKGDDFKKDDSEFNHYYIPFTNIANNSIIDPNRLDSVEIFENENQNEVRKNDLLFLMSSENYDDIGKTALLKVELENTYLNSFCKGFRLNNQEEIDANFLNYLLSGDIYRKILSIEAKGFTRINLQMGKIQNLPVILPNTKTEQTQIANYLNHKTNLIDIIINQKEQLIEKLKEQRQAVIKETVTKGLNPIAPLKDSGIEWLGKIPEHWELNRLFAICELVRGNSNFKKDELLRSGKYVALQYGKTYKVEEVNQEFEYYVNEEFYKESQVVNYGDTIIISTSETIEDLGHSVFYNRNDEGLLGGEQMLIRTKDNKMNPEYLFYSSKMFLTELRRYATGIKVFRFNINDLKNTITTLPPISEQTQIVEHIKIHNYNIENTIVRTKISIKKLKEYRQSIISEAVTGKIDVRDWKPKTT